MKVTSTKDGLVLNSFSALDCSGVPTVITVSSDIKGCAKGTQFITDPNIYGRIYYRSNAIAGAFASVSVMLLAAASFIF